MGGGSDSSEEVEFRPNNLVFDFLCTQLIIVDSVGDPDPQVPHVFGSSGAISQRSGSGSFPFLINVLRGLK